MQNLEQRDLEKAVATKAGALTIRQCSNNNDDPLPINIDICIQVGRQSLFGRREYVAQLRLGQLRLDPRSHSIQVPQLLVRHVFPAVKLIKAAFINGRQTHESFTNWVMRQPTGAFEVILKDLLIRSVADIAGVQGEDPSQRQKRENTLVTLTRRLELERRSMERELAVENYRDAIHYARNVLLLSGNTVLVSHRLPQSDDLYRLSDLLANHISSNQSIPAFFDVVVALHQRANRTLRYQDMHNFHEKLSHWLERVDWLLKRNERKSSQQRDIVDLSNEKMSDALMRILNILTEIKGSKRLAVRIRSGKAAVFLSAGLRLKGYEVLSHQTEGEGRTSLILVGELIRHHTPSTTQQRPVLKVI